MTLDPSTLLLTDILIILLVSLSYGVVWLENRKETALLWMLASALLAGMGLIFRFSLPFTFAVLLGNSCLEAGVGAIWMASRVLRGRPALPLLLLLPALGWSLALWLPGFSQALSWRVVVANCVVGGAFLLAAREIWLLATPNRTLRLFIFGLLAVQAAVNLVWAAYNLLLPVPATTPFLTMPGVKIFDVATLIFSLLMTIGMVGLIRERAIDHYRDAATVDPVTGLRNRRAFDEALREATRGAGRHGGVFSLVMTDIDSFKAFNDRYGHVEGDRCLRAVAERLAAALPQGGRAYRYGGEEFALLLPDLSLTEAVAATEAVRLAVRGLAWPHEAQASGIVTVSQGVACFGPGLRGGAGEAAAPALLSAADKALYRAKNEGRDRVVAAGTAEAAPLFGRIAS